MRTSVPRPLRRLLSLLALAALLAVPAFAGGTHGSKEAKASCALHHSPEAKAHAAAEAGAQKRAISDLRDVGTAMFAWYVDAVGARQELPKGEAPTSVRFDSVPSISHAELTKLLVPTYIAALPEKDPWGNPYEYRLNTTDLAAETIMALRTPGCDGEPAGETYAIGPFPPGDGTQDVVWMDGYFVRWPEAAEN